MDLFEAITKRRSIRKFQKKEVEWYKIADMIEAARYAPSAGNLQDWRFIVVRERSNIVALASAAYEQHWMEAAPACIVVCSDLRNTERLYGIRGTRLYAIQNASAAVENMLLTAQANGLGACWVGAFNEDEIAGIFHLPPFIRPQVIVAVGYPEEKPKEPLKTSLETITYFESWGSLSGRKVVPEEMLKYGHEYGELNEIRLGKAKDGMRRLFSSIRRGLSKLFVSTSDLFKRRKGKKQQVEEEEDEDSDLRGKKLVQPIGDDLVPLKSAYYPEARDLEKDNKEKSISDDDD